MDNNSQLELIVESSKKVLEKFNFLFIKHNIYLSSLSINNIIFENYNIVLIFNYENRYSHQFCGISIKFKDVDLFCNLLDVFRFLTNKDPYQEMEKEENSLLEIYRDIFVEYISPLLLEKDRTKLEEFYSYMNLTQIK